MDPHPRVTRLELAALVALLAGYLAALTALAWRTGVTVDEPSHLLSAHLYWKGQDTLRPRDMPPLIKMAGGWVSRGLGLPLPGKEHPVWTTRHE